MAPYRRRSEVIPATVLCAFLIHALVLCTCSANESRIVGGFPADGSRTRHQVSVRAKANDQVMFGRGHICGGSLITLDTVLTAAHCLVDSNDKPRAASYFRVVGGNINRTSQSTNTVVRDVKQVVVHAGYVARGFLNDIGLLMLTTNVPSGHPTLQPITMATVVPSNGTSCQTSGWGSIVYDGPSSDVLLAVNVSIIAKTTCNALTSYGGSIVNGMLCAGEMAGGKDACQGDSGGPLVCGGVLTGVVSHGVKCAEPLYPGVYADVPYYRSWIAMNHTAATPRPPGSNGRGSSMQKGNLALVLIVVAFALRQRLTQQ